MPLLRIALFIVTLSACFQLFASPNRNNQNCGIEPGQPLSNAYGPWDFTNPAHRPNLPIVINAHFTSSVENLISGNRGSLIADLDYTLRAIPNYHRALAAMAKYQRKNKLDFKLLDEFYTAECYFKRALYMQPEDAVSMMLYASHLQLTGHLDDAEKQYLHAIKLQPDNSEIHYNLGLLYIKKNDIDKASKHADIAYKNNYPLSGLRNLLKQKSANRE
ncbi:tetratricopeptide repeat protein [Bowmanella pacifica]|nr:tetratricopeptide repeat protein [Bowmanella pacifica]